jgi:DNA topoisomerase II
MQEGDKELIELAFSKKKADDRKEWLRTYRVRLIDDGTNV